MISNVYANVSDWREIAAVIDQTVPSFLGLLFDQQMSHMFTANIDVLNKSKGTGVSQRYPAHDNPYNTHVKVYLDRIILLLSANPTPASPHELAEECRDIRKGSFADTPC
ncbi:unnamed protein product [Trichobilharzia regenti]|nr:unnamed protein product [Trichobilharzia regenti]